MKKGKILIFLIIIIYAFVFVALYYYKDSSDNLNKQKFKRDFKKSEALKIVRKLIV